MVRIAGGGAAPSPLHPPTRFYFVTDSPCYLLLFLLLFPSASMIRVCMRFFLRTSFLVRIAGGGAAPSPLHPPTPLSVCNWRPLLPTPIPFAFSISINDLGSYALLSWSALRPHPLIFCNRRPLLPTPIPFAFSISINDLGSYVLLSSYFFLGTAALPPAPPHPLLCLIRLPFLPSLIPSCHEHRLFDFILFFLILINIHGN